MGRRQRELLCVLVSGGLDSAVLLHRLFQRGQRLVPVYVRCGFMWEPTELYWMRRLLRTFSRRRVSPLRVVTLPLQSVYGSHWSFTARRIPGARSADAAVYLPGRNVLLLTAAAIVCAQHRGSGIALGTLRGNPFGDATPRFFRQMAACLSQALSHPIRILTPLRHMRKSELIRHAAGVPFELTFSCLHPRGRCHCGGCNKCAERRRAFCAAGITDPTNYTTRSTSFVQCGMRNA